MSVIEKLENYWRGVCDPRYSNTANQNNSNPNKHINHNNALNGKFDRASRRCQSSLNIHAHAHHPHPLSKHNTLQRKLSTTPLIQQYPHQQQHYQQQQQQQQHQYTNNNANGHGKSHSNLIVHCRCRLCDENHRKLSSSASLTLTNPNRKLISSQSQNQNQSQHNLQQHGNSSSSSPSPDQSYHNLPLGLIGSTPHIKNQHQESFRANGKFITRHNSSPDGKFCERDDLLIEALEDRKSTCPNPDVNQPDPYESVKMRLQKPEGRPKSLEFSQRKAWMRVYRDMELSTAVTDRSNANAKDRENLLSSSPTGSNSKGKKSSKGRSKSILHLHRLDSSQPDVTKENVNLDTISTASDESQCSSLKQSQQAGASLFQRFSKTFSLRFGSGSSSSSSGSKAKKVKYPVGSSPDLFHRADSENSKESNSNSGWKWRQSSLNPQREEKCRSGDSGIGIVPEDSTLRNKSTRRPGARRVKSENIDAILEGHSLSGNPSQQSINSLSASAFIHSSPIPHIDSPICRKLSLVEIPDHTWEVKSRNNSDHGSGSEKSVGRDHQGPETPRKLSSASHELTKSYEDLFEAKLDDDGFVSSDEQDSSCSDKPSASPSELLISNNMSNTTANNYSNNINTSENSETTSNGAVVEKEIPEIIKTVRYDCGKIINRSNSGSGSSSIREKVVNDILKTEHNYVKTLNDIVQGFLVPCRRRTDLFSVRVIENIFSNVEDILRLHARFLEALVSCLDKENPADSPVGRIFTLWTDEFDLYCDYCCNNPISMVKIQNLTVNPEYAEFFEACRRIQMMDKLPLHGFLLRPIQRICQYHLQLNELLKQTEADNKDYESTREALDSMKKVAQKVNDTQRQFDSLHEIMKLQNSMDLFEGPNLMEKSSSILHRGDLVKAHQGRKHKEVHVIVLGSELVICKRLQKDITRKNGLLFMGRIDLNQKKLHDIDSSQEDEIFGVVHNSWRIYSKEKSCWVLFTTMTATEKTTWLDILSKAGSDKLTATINPKMRERVKELIIEQNQLTLFKSQTQNPYQNNTLPKSKKSGKSKLSNANSNNNNNNTNNSRTAMSKVDSDAMLIEVGKLKRNNHFIVSTNGNGNNGNGILSSNSNNSRTSSVHKDNRTSTFYV